MLAEDDWWPALPDEPEQFRPQMPFVVGSFSLSGTGEWLAGAGGRPDWSVRRPSGELQGEFPPGNAPEQVNALESHKVCCLHVCDASFIDNTFHDKTGGHQVAEPRGAVWVGIVVVGTHY